MNDIKYKDMEFHIDEGLTLEEYNLLQKINEQFTNDDIYIEYLHDKLIVHLNKLDLEKLESLIRSINIPNDSIFYNILKKIKGIGSYGIKGGKRVFVDYDKERKVLDRKAKEKKRNKQFYTVGHNFSTKNNKCPEEFLDRIICGDSEQVLKELPDNCIDLILTSPPYNFGLEYDNDDDDSHYWENYFRKIENIFSECIRVLKYGGRFVLNVQPLFSDYIPTHHMFSNFFIKNKMIWKGEILWEKNNYNCKYTSWGSWMSPSSPYLKYTWEFIEIYCKGDLRKPGPKDKIDLTPEEFKSWVVAKWSIAPERRMKEYGHPAMFPEELARRVIKLFSYQGDVILDPFNGAGTTTVVAKKNKRRYIGIDISEEYCKVAQDRINSLEDDEYYAQ
ncbi:DNA-methyltransferase [Thermosediminibacter litoriperuensis]|uniref:Methyltransferase n=1 Tax=Thermosediminibacter litoriperuensis TaxID=291989 RepID=A0A5S5AHD1_9FIRM|nr:site-specific DNA-methyltransferase [Thermosediminibacter litoriperuensis]TYP48146.1 DNA modification methylase [Thermosediminibacter litoriperuensis]